LDLGPDLSPFLLDLHLHLHLKDLDLDLKPKDSDLDLDMEVLSASPISSPLNSTIEKMYKELIAYLCIHCVLTGSAAPTDATIAELLGKYLGLLAEHECTETDSSSDSLVSWKHNESAYDKVIPYFLRSFVIPASSAPVERVFSHGGLVLRPNRACMNVR